MQSEKVCTGSSFENKGYRLKSLDQNEKLKMLNVEEIQNPPIAARVLVVSCMSTM